MKNREKLNLIEKYIDIFRILHHCKQTMRVCNQYTEIKFLNNLCEEILLFKKKIEEFFVKDNSFLLLKSQLENEIISPTTEKSQKHYTKEFLDNQKRLIEKEIKNLL